jgi:hypothetical protein
LAVGDFIVSIQSNSEYHGECTGTQSLGAKLQGQEGNNPDLRLRSLNLSLVGKEVRMLKQL